MLAVLASQFLASSAEAFAQIGALAVLSSAGIREIRD
jgi:hypothetical protein